MAHVEATKLDAAEETHHYEHQRTRPHCLTTKTHLTRRRGGRAEARRTRSLFPQFFAFTPVQMSDLSAPPLPPRLRVMLLVFVSCDLSPHPTKFGTLKIRGT